MIRSQDDVDDQFDNTMLAEEVFQHMEVKNLIQAVVLYAITCVIVVTFLWFSPTVTYTKESKVSVTGQTREVGLELHLTNLKFYHRSVSWGIRMERTERRITDYIITVNGFIKLKKNGNLVRDFIIDNNAFHLKLLQFQEVFSTGQYNVDEIVANINLISADNYFNEFVYVWVFENYSFIFFHSMIRGIIFLIVCFSLFKFRKTLSQLDCEPTYMQALTSRLSPILALCFFPLPELFNLIGKFNFVRISEYFDFISISFMIVYVVISAWDLPVHNTEEESSKIELYYGASIITIVLLLIPKAIKLFNNELQNFLEHWLQLFIILGVTFSLLFIPDRLKPGTPQLRTCLVHIVFAILPSIFYSFYKATSVARNSKIGLLMHLYSSISFIFVLFMHWPLDPSSSLPSYISLPRESSARSKPDRAVKRVNNL